MLGKEMEGNGRRRRKTEKKEKEEEGFCDKLHTHMRSRTHACPYTLYVSPPPSLMSTQTIAHAHTHTLTRKRMHALPPHSHLLYPLGRFLQRKEENEPG